MRRQIVVFVGAVAGCGQPQQQDVTEVATNSAEPLAEPSARVSAPITRDAVEQPTEAELREFVVGSWAYSENDCGTSFGAIYTPNGKFVDDDVIGSWDIEEVFIARVPVYELGDDGETARRIPDSDAQYTRIAVDIVGPNRMRLTFPVPAKEIVMVRCGDEDADWLNEFEV